MNKIFSMKYAGLWVIAILLVFSVSFLIFRNVNTKESDFFWNSFDIEIAVQNNGDMLITETQECFCNTTSSGGYRWIPYNKFDDIDNIEVFLEEEQLSINTSVVDDVQWITWNYSMEEGKSYTFIVRYRIMGGIEVNEKGDRIFWRTYFENRDAPIQSGRVIVTLPKALATYPLEVKSFGVVADNRMIDSSTVEFTPRQALEPGEWLDIEVVFPHDIIGVQQPRWQQQ